MATLPMTMQLLPLQRKLEKTASGAYVTSNLSLKIKYLHKDLGFPRKHEGCTHKAEPHF